MRYYEEARDKLTNIQLDKLKYAVKNKTGTTLRETKKIIQDEESPYKLFLTTRQKIKIRNALVDSLGTSIVRMDHMNGNHDFHLTEHPICVSSIWKLIRVYSFFFNHCGCVWINL